MGFGILVVVVFHAIFLGVALIIVGAVLPRRFKRAQNWLTGLGAALSIGAPLIALIAAGIGAYVMFWTNL